MAMLIVNDTRAIAPASATMMENFEACGIAGGGNPCGTCPTTFMLNISSLENLAKYEIRVATISKTSYEGSGIRKRALNFGLIQRCIE
jgi:hypothetical protein